MLLFAVPLLIFLIIPIQNPVAYNQFKSKFKFMCYLNEWYIMNSVFCKSNAYSIWGIMHRRVILLITALLNHAYILSSSHILHFHTPHPVEWLHRNKNTVAEAVVWHHWPVSFCAQWTMSTQESEHESVFSEISQEGAGCKQSWCSDDQMNVGICSCVQYIFHPTQRAINWMCFNGSLFGLSVPSHVCALVPVVHIDHCCYLCVSLL